MSPSPRLWRVQSSVVARFFNPNNILKVSGSPAFPLFLALLLVELAALVCVFLLRHRLYLLPSLRNRCKESPHTASLPRISVVLTACDRADALAKNIPLLLEQDYPRFEVIVVNNASTDETKELLERMAWEDERLRHTFVPDTTRYIDRRKLAITLGIRASRGEWVVLTEADCRPDSRHWLQRMVSRMGEGRDFVLGYANYEDDGSRMARRAVFERLKRHLLYAAAAWSGRAIGGDGCNLAVRRAWFLENNGFKDSLAVPLGADDLLVSALARRGNAAPCLHPEAVVRQELPVCEVLRNSRVHRREVMRHTGRRSAMYRYADGAASLLSSLFLLSAIVYVAWRVVDCLADGAYPLASLLMDIPLLLLLSAFFALPVWCLRRTTTAIGERPFGLIVCFYDFMQPFRNLSHKWKRRCWRHEFVRK